MKENYTHIVYVLDQSGSMGKLREDTVAGFNTMVKDQRCIPGQATFQLIRFNDVVMPEAVADIHSVQLLDNLRYRPNGWTALLDAVGLGIDSTGKFLSGLPEAMRPSRVVFIIATDGLENRSITYHKQKVAGMIAHQQMAYKWEFVFVGANIDAFKEAGDMGIMDSHTMQHTANSFGTQALYAAASSNLKSYRVGASVNMAWTEEQRKAQEQAKNQP